MAPGSLELPHLAGGRFRVLSHDRQQRLLGRLGVTVDEVHDGALVLADDSRVGLGQAGEQLRAPVVVQNALDDRRAELRHALGEPGRHTAAVQGQVGEPGALHRWNHCSGWVSFRKRFDPGREWT